MARPRAAHQEDRTTTCRATRQDAVDIYKLDEGQVGIPFAIYPSALFYKKGLFDEAGLKEPPHKYGDQYQMPDGTMADWNYDTSTRSRSC